MKRPMCWTVAGLLLATSTPQAESQTATDFPSTAVLHVTAPRARLVVRRGWSVELRGKAPQSDDPVKVSLICRGKPVATAECQSEWSLKWDSDKEQADSVFLTVSCVLGTGEVRQLARVEVNLLTKVPFELKASTRQDPGDDTAVLALIRTGDLVPKQYSLFVDGSRIDANFTPTGSAAVTTAGMVPGKRSFAVRVGTEDGSEIDTDPVAVIVPERARILPLDNQGPVDLRSRDEGRIVFRLETEPGLRPTKVAYYIDDAKVAEAGASPFDQCAVDVRKLASGTRRAYAYVYTEDGKRYRSGHVEFEVLRDVKREFEEWYTALRQAIEPAHGQIEVLYGVIYPSGGDIVQRSMETDAAIATIQAVIPRVAAAAPPKSLAEKDLFTARQAHALFTESLRYALVSMASARVYLDRLRSGIASYGADARLWPDAALQRLAQARTATGTSLDAARSRYASADGDVALIRQRLKEAASIQDTRP